MSRFSVALSGLVSEVINGPVSGTIDLVQKFNEILNLDANSTPDNTVSWADTLALSGGALTVDLTSLTQMDGTALDLTGQYVHTALIIIPGANSMTFVAGAANPYNLFPATNATTVDGLHFIHNRTGFSTVSGTVKTIDVTGTGTDSFYIFLGTGTT